jgi:hypothetical protein
MHSRGGLASESSPSRVISASKPTSFQNSAAVRRAAQRRPACAVIENEAASRSRNKSHNIVKQAEEELSGQLLPHELLVWMLTTPLPFPQSASAACRLLLDTL